MSSRHPSGPGRAAALAAAAAVAVGGLTACGDSAGPETGTITIEDLQDIEARIGGVDQRLRALEERAGAGAPTEETFGLFDDPADHLGREVTVSAEVSELYETTDVGSAFRMAGDGGNAIAVVSAGRPVEIRSDDVVRVSGTVVQVDRDTFERDFGVTDDELFADPGVFYDREEAELAIDADSVEVLQETGGD